MMGGRSQALHSDAYARTEPVGANRIARAIELTERLDRILASKPEDHEAYRRLGWLRQSLGISE
jgi:hypothetical protein